MICYDCPARAVPDRGKCQRCLDRTALRVRRLRRKRTQAGKCLYCDKPPGVWRSMCDHHRRLLLKRKATPQYRLKAKVAREKWKLKHKR